MFITTNNIKQIMFSFIILLFLPYSNSVFTPNSQDYNAYGLKIVMNELLLIEVKNEYNPPKLLIQFAPYNTSTSSSSRCMISSSNMTNHYIYTLTLSKNQTQFFIAGELINGRNGTFVGVVKYNPNSTDCTTSFSFDLQYFYDYDHQEYHVIDVETKGQYVYGFSNAFIFVYDLYNHSVVKVLNGSSTWPDPSFIPHALDVTDTFGVLAGFIRNPVQSPTIYISIVYLINFNSTTRHPFIVDQYIPAATPGTWQDLLINADANLYSPKYDMSVSINSNGYILVGMQFINRVFLLSVNLTNPIQLYNISRNTNGRSVGNGKSIVWLDNGIAAVLVNTYTLDYQWISSQVYFYDIQSHGYDSNSVPLSVFPNNHQLLPSTFSAVFLQIVSSPSSLAILDDRGNILVLNPTAPGHYPSIDDTRSSIVFSTPKRCLPGTYKNQSGAYDCILCPSGTRNPGDSNIECIQCLNNSFCSLGAVSDVSIRSLENINQVLAYPKSPEETIFDEILMQNMFNIGSGHCLVVSPIFWTIIVAIIGLLIVLVMGVLKICIDHSHAKKVRYGLKSVFRRIDLINEGELWISGVGSVAFIVLISFAFAFSKQFSGQYPIETSTDSTFACDLSLRNAKFQTNLQSTSIRGTDSEEIMFALLDQQQFYLNVQFINTLISCDAVSIQALYGTQWDTIRWANCTNNNSVLTLTIELPYQDVSVRIVLDSIETIGALRIGLYGQKNASDHYNLRELNFYTAFHRYGYILAQNLPLLLDLTKVVNETLGMNSDKAYYSGIYVPTFVINRDSLFLTESQYIRSSLASTTFEIRILETPYYVHNAEEPIAKRFEIVFHNLLFTTVCLELFGLVFLLYKLAVKPICRLLFPKHFPKEKEEEVEMHDHEK